MEEVWKDIEGYEGLYQISNFGNVKSLNYRRTNEEKLLVPKTNNDGYLWVQLFGGARNRCFLVHRLVACAFVENPGKYDYVNHKDENKANNKASNLEWCTHLYNVQYSSIRHVRVRNPRRTRKIVQLGRADNKVLCMWDNLISIKHETGWSDWSIGECCKGNRKTAYGYIWRYADEYIAGREVS